MDPVEFRKKVKELFDRVERALLDIDPDVVECEQAAGTLNIVLADGARCILSTQPSVSQIWLALASKGVAHHFNFDIRDNKWRDDKGKGVELESFLAAYLKETAGLNISFDNKR